MAIWDDGGCFSSAWRGYFLTSQTRTWHVHGDIFFKDHIHSFSFLPNVWIIEVRQILLWIRITCPRLSLKRKTGSGSQGRSKLPFGKRLRWLLRSVQIWFYASKSARWKSQISTGKGEDTRSWQCGIKGPWQAQGPSSTAQALPLRPACSPALHWDTQFGKLFTKFKKWFTTKSTRAFIASIYSSLRTRIGRHSGTTNPKAAITEIIHPI